MLLLFLFSPGELDNHKEGSLNKFGHGQKIDKSLTPRWSIAFAQMPLAHKTKNAQTHTTQIVYPQTPPEERFIHLLVFNHRHTESWILIFAPFFNRIKIPWWAWAPKTFETNVYLFISNFRLISVLTTTTEKPLHIVVPLYSTHQPFICGWFWKRHPFSSEYKIVPSACLTRNKSWAVVQVWIFNQ